MKLWQDLPPSYYNISNFHKRNIFQTIGYSAKEWETAYQYRKPFLFLIRLSCNVLLSTGGITVCFSIVTNTFSLSFWINHLPLWCVRGRFTRETQSGSRPWLTVRLWSVFLLLLRVSAVSQWSTEGLLSFVRQFYTVFSSSLQKTTS